MNKKQVIRNIALFFSILMGVISLSTVSVAAKSKGVTVIRNTKMAKSSNRAVNGYMYTSAKLTKKAHNADNYPTTTFYTYRSATIRRANGNSAVYYYVKNGNGKVKGWIWRGNLVPLLNFSKQRSELRRIVSLINSISSKNRQNVIKLLETINNHDSLSSVVNKLNSLAKTFNNSSDVKKIKEINQILLQDGKQIIQLTQSLINKTYTTVTSIHQVTQQVANFIQMILNLLP
ncbi:D-alanyl-D-alanine carboxypeptidase [Lentilactobacillus sp. SPB1-3]|uniref:D-alanyl-D-alanine carboxypeptidase n=1 Tax=Lentilactobacillus terminaliae TaxID=3003483 RepID=A0ACD5DDY2_9LACO|nr:D-alanyl-D-alanine carboxypeptidase [Lentilactobacillus sp. SPB1-3]MCZ0977501.1 D-alanyl-D-alanine carboxypeptidase [Lentilactobacillus sp. SPB1-3]